MLSLRVFEVECLEAFVSMICGNLEYGMPFAEGCLDTPKNPSSGNAYTTFTTVQFKPVVLIAIVAA